MRSKRGLVMFKTYFYSMEKAVLKKTASRFIYITVCLWIYTSHSCIERFYRGFGGVVVRPLAFHLKGSEFEPCKVDSNPVLM